MSLTEILKREPSDEEVRAVFEAEANLMNLEAQVIKKYGWGDFVLPTMEEILKEAKITK